MTPLTTYRVRLSRTIREDTTVYVAIPTGDGPDRAGAVALYHEGQLEWAAQDANDARVVSSVEVDRVPSGAHLLVAGFEGGEGVR